MSRGVGNMPNKIPIAQMEKWLKSYEEGKSEASIAKAAHRDVRTVKRGIEQARRQRDVQSARSELLKEAVRSHQADLYAVIDNIESAISVPEPKLAVPLQRPSPAEPLMLSWAAVWFDINGQPIVSLANEETPMWDLLKEHLRRDPIWEAIRQWKGSLTAHIVARIELKQQAVALLTQETELSVLEDKPSEGAWVYSGTADLLCLVAVHRVLGMRDTTFEEGELVLQPDGRVMLSLLDLAGAPGSQEQCRDGILKARDSLLTSTQAASVAETYRALEADTEKAIRALEEIRLLRLVPGTCRICRRLGM